MLSYISGMAGLNVWYVRRGDEVKGPYPSGLITRYVLLGRVRADDEVSMDGATWGLVSDHPDLIPSVMKNPDAAPQRLEAARRWADERDGERRSADGAPETVAGAARHRRGNGRGGGGDPVLLQTAAAGTVGGLQRQACTQRQLERLRADRRESRRR